MARNNRGGSSRASSASRGSDRSGAVMDIARDRPIATAAVAAGAAAAGLFLWSKRSQITNELSRLSDQIGEWTEKMSSESSLENTDDNPRSMSTSSRASGTRSTTNRNRGMSETGGGNSSVGASSGGGGTLGSASGRGRARSTATTQD